MFASACASSYGHVQILTQAESTIPEWGETFFSQESAEVTARPLGEAGEWDREEKRPLEALVGGGRKGGWSGDQLVWMDVTKCSLLPTPQHLLCLT